MRLNYQPVRGSLRDTTYDSITKSLKKLHSESTKPRWTLNYYTVKYTLETPVYVSTWIPIRNSVWGYIVYKEGLT